MRFTVIGEISNIETIALRHSIRILAYLRRQYGEGRWRKMKGIALVQLADGSVRRAELHWFEAQGIGRKKMRVKRFLS